MITRSHRNEKSPWGTYEACKQVWFVWPREEEAEGRTHGSPIDPPMEALQTPPPWKHYRLLHGGPTDPPPMEVLQIPPWGPYRPSHGGPTDSSMEVLQTPPWKPYRPPQGGPTYPSMGSVGLTLFNIPSTAELGVYFFPPGNLSASH